MITGTDFLCNELKASRDSELEFFLPQLCNLLLHTNSLPLERYAAPRKRHSTPHAARPATNSGAFFPWLPHTLQIHARLLSAVGTRRPTSLLLHEKVRMSTALWLLWWGEA